MRLVKITHDRCNEYDGHEYVLAPDDWPAPMIYEKVRAVVAAAIKDAKEVTEPPFERPPPFPPYKDYPDKTVREIDELHAAEKERYAEWMGKHTELTRSFQERLKLEGFVPLWENEANAVEVTATWGHNHGLDLGYARSDF